MMRGDRDRFLDPIELAWRLMPRNSGSAHQVSDPDALHDRVDAQRAGDHSDRNAPRQPHPTPGRMAGQADDLPQGGVVPPLRPGAQVDHDVAGLVPRGAVTILMSMTRPHPITA